MRRYIIDIIMVLVMCCIGFIAWLYCINDNNNTASNIDSSVVYTVRDCKPCHDDLNRIAQTEDNNIMLQIMDTLENNFAAAGFDVVRDSANHITIKE